MKNKTFIILIIIIIIAGVFVYAYKSKTKVVKNSEVVVPTFSTYTEPAGTYSFNYNPLFSVVNGDKSKQTTDWRSNTTTEGTLLTTLTIPRSFMPSTNFSEAKFTIGRSADASVIKSCTTIEKWAGKSSDVFIGGQKFKEVSLSDAGAGNFYDTTSYRAVLDGDCYVIEYTIHSTNIGNYSPDQGIKEFDKSKIVSELNNIVQSLKFQLASN